MLVLTDSMAVGLGKYMLSVLCNLFNRKSGEEQKRNKSTGHLPLFAASILPVTIGYMKEKSGTQWS